MRVRIALLLMLPIVVLTIVLASAARYRGAMSVDNRTYVEMAAGVRAHGLPYTLNAYSHDFPEARPAFNVARHGKLWGNYPPLYAYVGAVALEAAGLAGLAKQNIVLIGVLACLVFAVGWRFTRDPLRGVAASYVAVFATPVWAGSTETLALPLLYVLITLAVLLAIVTVETRQRWRGCGWALLAGFVAGLALATHLLALTMSAALILAIVIVTPDPTRVRDDTRWLPNKLGIERGAAASLGMLLVFVPMGLLNRHRFGSYNPISYGPCEWARCYEGVQGDVNAGSIVSFALPGLFYFALVGAALFVARRRHSWRGALVVIGLAIAVVAPPTPLRDSVLRMSRTVFGYAFDTASLDFDPYPEAFDDKFGHGRVNILVKSFLQSSPILLCGLLAPFARRGRGGRALLILAPVIGLFVSLALLGRFKGAFAFGWPHVLLRYTLPAAPLLAVLAVDTLAGLAWRRVHVALGVIVGAGGLYWFWPQFNDYSLARRIVIVVLTLVAAGWTTASVLAARRSPRRAWRESAVFGAAVALGMSVAISMGVDSRLLSIASTLLDDRVERLAELTPQRFALAGFGPPTDQALPLRAERDINYIDLVEAPYGSFENFRLLIDLWTEDGRPIYGSFFERAKPPFDDTDVPCVQLDPHHEYWRIGPPVHPLSKEQLAARRALMRAQLELRAAAASNAATRD